MNVQLIKALVAQLEAAHRIAAELESQATAERKSHAVDNLGSLLAGIVTRVSGETGGDDSGKKEVAPQEANETPVQGNTAEAPVTTAKSTDEILVEMLNDPEHKLRTADALIEKSGFNGDRFDLAEYLEDDLNLDVVTKTRRRDGKALIGLASRN